MVHPYICCLGLTRNIAKPIRVSSDVLWFYLYDIYKGFFVDQSKNAREFYVVCHFCYIAHFIMDGDNKYKRSKHWVWLTLPQEDLALEVSGAGFDTSSTRFASSSSANPQLQFLQALAFLVVAHTNVTDSTTFNNDIITTTHTHTLTSERRRNRFFQIVGF